MKWIERLRRPEVVTVLFLIAVSVVEVTAVIGIMTLYSLYFWFSRITGVHVTLF